MRYLYNKIRLYYFNKFRMEDNYIDIAGINSYNFYEYFQNEFKYNNQLWNLVKIEDRLIEIFYINSKRVFTNLLLKYYPSVIYTRDVKDNIKQELRKLM